MLNKIFSVIGGVFIGSIVVYLVQRINHALYPMPADIVPGDMQALEDFIQTLPVSAFLLLVLSHILGTLAAAFSAARLARDTKPGVGFIVVFIMLVATVSGSFMVPQPAWVTLLDIAGVLFFGYLGVKLGAAISSHQ